MKKNTNKFLVDPLEKAARRVQAGFACISYDVAWATGKREAARLSNPVVRNLTEKMITSLVIENKLLMGCAIPKC